MGYAGRKNGRRDEGKERERRKETKRHREGGLSRESAVD